MRARYTAQLVARDPRGSGWIVTRTRSFGTRERARRWLVRCLPPVICTRYTYHRDLGRSGWGDVFDEKRGRVVATVEPEVFEVPSVGELGVTP